MEKLKNLVNPGSKKDDEVLYGSGNIDDPVLTKNNNNTTSGEGSHFGNSRTTDPLSSSTNPTSTSGYGNTGGNDPLSTSTNPTSSTGYDNTARNDPYTTSTNPTSSTGYDNTARNDPYTTSTNPTSSTGYDNTARNDPYTTSTNPTSSTGYDNTARNDPYTTSTNPTSSTGYDNTARNDPYTTSTNPTSSTGYDNTARNDPYTTSTNPTSSTGYDNTARNDPYTTSTNPTSSTGYDNSARNDPFTTSTNPTGASQYDTGATERGVGGLNEPSASRMPGGFEDDAATTASVSSGVPGQSQSRSGFTGTNDPDLRNTTGAGSSLTGNEYPDRSIGSTGVNDQNYAPETGRSFPLGGNSNPTSGSQYPSGQTGTYPTGGAAGSTTAGPHSSNLANKVDPRVDSDLDGSRTTGTTGLGSGTGPSVSLANQGSLGRDPALASGTGYGDDMTSATRTGTGSDIGSGIGAGAGLGGPQSWEHNHKRHGHTYEGDPCATGEAVAPVTLHTDGPHVTDTANRLDPHVAEDGTTSGGHHHGHTGRDAALAGGVGGGAYEASRDTQGTTADTSVGSGLDPYNRDTEGTSSTGNTAGPHKSDLLNKLDPRVDSDLSKQQSTTGTTGTGLDPSSTDHHYGRDAGLAGAGGAAVYEAEKHHRDNEPTSTTSGMSSSDPYSSSGVDPRVDNTGSGYGGTTDTTGMGKDHHLGRDAALGAGAGGLAYEAERAHGKPTQSSTIPSDTTGAAYDNTTGPTGSGYDQAGTALAGSGHQPTTGYADNRQPQTTSHHLGRDAALGAGAGGAAYEAEEMINTGRTEPGTQVREQKHPGASMATYPSPGYGNDAAIDPSERRAQGHRKEDAAIAGGAGLGAGAIADHELSKKDEKHLAKEQQKEEKALEKEQHKHEKALAKDERKHEKALEKEEKKEEKHEKKHGGLLGFLHRDKGDKHAKDEPVQAEASGKVRGGPEFDEEMSAPAGAATRGPIEDEYGTQSAVNDPSLYSGEVSGAGSGTGMGHGITTHDAYGTQEGQNKLHKDPPAKVLESRGLDQPGSGY